MLPTFYEVELTRLSHNGKSGLRNNKVLGYCRDLPIVKRAFRMIGDPLETTVGARFITTSPVQLIEDNHPEVGDRVISFKTLNSEYSLRVIQPVPDTHLTTYHFLLDPSCPL